jgi:hypothetical protein
MRVSDERTCMHYYKLLRGRHYEKINVKGALHTADCRPSRDRHRSCRLEAVPKEPYRYLLGQQGQPFSQLCPVVLFALRRRPAVTREECGPGFIVMPTRTLCMFRTAGSTLAKVYLSEVVTE